MNKSIEIIKTLHNSTLKLVEGLSIEQLNKIPEGFINNVGWNVGHMVASMQGVCYTRSGLPTAVEESVIASYRPGTKPEKVIEPEEFEQIKSLLVSAVDQLEKDYNDGIFKEYPAFTTRYGVELACIDDAINFLPFHDGLHMGYIMALKRVI